MVGFMCIITFHYKQHPTYKLIVVANRDEFYERPTKALHFWDDEPNVLAGRDLKALGTWLGMTKEKRFAALTNFRDLKNERDDRKSRGEIVRNFLTSSVSPREYLEELHKESDEYNGFNVLVGSPDELYYYSNIQKEIVEISPGTHSISNHLLNTPWPKVKRAKEKLNSYVMNHEELDVEHLFHQLYDREIAHDDELPDTGVGIELERKLSPIFIQTENYGTRASTVILVNHDNETTFIERTFNSGSLKSERKFTF